MRVERRELELLLRIQPCEAQQLLDEPRELFDFERDIAELLRGEAGLEPRAQRRERRAQFMGRIGGEFPLRAIVRFEPVQRDVRRLHQRQKLAGKVLVRQSLIQAMQRQPRGLMRDGTQRAE